MSEEKKRRKRCWFSLGGGGRVDEGGESWGRLCGGIGGRGLWWRRGIGIGIVGFEGWREEEMRRRRTWR